ncbi:MAG: hypothetical protein H6850_01435 [Alphaproteobacteria bacterium]|nr:MAG: hypothetical protein H6850_01435 [Alphaproteobacteria bacterium]
MAKFIYSCQNEGFTLEVDDSTKNYTLKGPVSQTGKLVNKNISIGANNKFYCCSDSQTVLLLLVDPAGQYEAIEFNHMGQVSQTFVPRCGKFGAQTMCGTCDEFLALTCCDILDTVTPPATPASPDDTQGEDGFKEIYVAMKENGQILIYRYTHTGSPVNVGSMNTPDTGPLTLQKMGFPGNVLELVDLNCCGTATPGLTDIGFLQVIARDITDQEYVSAAINPAAPSATPIDLEQFEAPTDLPLSASFIKTFCCNNQFFAVFEVNGQNRVYKSAAAAVLNQVGLVDLNTGAGNHLVLGASGDKFVSLLCCDVTTAADSEIVVIMRGTDGKFKFHIFETTGATTQASGVTFGAGNEAFVSVTCCEEVDQVFVTLKDASGKFKLFGFNNAGGLVGGTFTNGLTLFAHECNADMDLQSEVIFVFQNDDMQNFIFIVDPDGTNVICPASVGYCGDIVERIECCDIAKNSDTGAFEKRAIFVVLRDARLNQLRLHVLVVTPAGMGIPALLSQTMNLGTPGDSLAHIECCDFTREIITTGASGDKEFVVVLKTPQGLHKLELYNISENGTGVTEVYGHTYPKTLGLKGDKFFALVCCEQTTDIKRLILVLKNECHFSAYSFLDLTTTQATVGQKIKIAQDAILQQYFQYVDDGVVFAYKISGGSNVLFILNADGTTRICPVELPDGRVQNVGFCDIDNNGFNELIVTMKEANGQTRLYVLTDTGTTVPIFSRIIADRCERFVDFLCCDLDNDHNKELAFLFRNDKTCCYRLVVYDRYGDRCFCQYISDEGLQFVNMSCCGVRNDESNDVMLTFKNHKKECYTLYAYNSKGCRYRLFDLQFKESKTEVVFRYTVGFYDERPKLYKVTKCGDLVHCPKTCCSKPKCDEGIYHDDHHEADYCGKPTKSCGYSEGCGFTEEKEPKKNFKCKSTCYDDEYFEEECCNLGQGCSQSNCYDRSGCCNYGPNGFY